MLFNTFIYLYSQAEAQAKGAACLGERYVGKDKVGKAAGAGVQLPEQESGAYKVKGDSTKSKAVRQAGQRALQRLTSFLRAALGYITGSKRQRT
jgi:hypothetical protein